MANICESLIIPAQKEKIFEMVTDFENFVEFFPYAESVKIIENKNNQIITEEIISFNYHGLKYKIEQKTMSKILNDEIESTSIHGPLKGTILKTKFEEIDNGTRVSVSIDLKTNLKYKFMSPLIKNLMKRMSLGVLYKMMTKINAKND